MTMHKSCRLSTLCSHSCLANFTFTLHCHVVLQWVAPMKNPRVAITSFRGTLLVYFFALFSCYVRRKSPWSWCTRGAMNLSVSGVHPWEGPYLLCRPEARRGFGKGNGINFQLNLQNLCLLGSLGTAPLGSYFIYNLYIWSIGQKVRNLPRKCSTSKGEGFVHISLLWRISPIYPSVPICSLQRKIKLKGKSFSVWIRRHMENWWFILSYVGKNLCIMEQSRGVLGTI